MCLIKHFYTKALTFAGLSKMSSHMCTIAVCQLTSTNNKEANLKSVKKLVEKAAQENAKMVFLPEACDYVANNKEEITSLAETLDGPLMSEYRKLAQKYKVWLSIGGFHEIVNGNCVQKLRNSHVLLNELGEITGVYRKIHLFDVYLPEKNLDLKESSYVCEGNDILPPVDTPAGPLALSICYDMRFPELSVILRKKGAHILTFPSAFTSTTGEAHWEVLLRSRAIENQCYVVAAAQYGCHNSKRTSFGQALVVDPWGKIIAECPKYNPTIPSNECVAIANIDRNVLSRIREEMPVFKHRRDDIYQLTTMKKSNNVENKVEYMFGDKLIPYSTVFYSTPYSYAFTNIRCVVPGHVLVSSMRVAKRLQDLTTQEVTDIFETAIKVQRVVEKVYLASSSTLCIQDGEDAGQTVQHVHCHILPRKVNDFERNDDIYVELAKHDRQNNQPIRSLEEMSDEANKLKPYFI